MLGYLCVFLATISSIYVRELVRLLGRPFIRAHHIASVTGLLLLLVHPLAAAWELRSMAVFIPVTDSWSGFLRWGGRPALYLMLIGALAAVLRKPLGRNWRLVHWLNYLVLLLATVHAVLLGSDFRSLAGRAVIALIALTGVGVFVRRRIPARRPRARR
jgi:predicted ferric reductase